MSDCVVKSLEAEKEFWRERADYGHFNRSEWERQLARDDLDFSFFEDKVVCEVGCGPFGMIYFLKARHRIGVDPLIPYYRELGLLSDNRTEGMTLIAGDGEALKEIEDDSIDVVICYNVLDHVRKPGDVLEEIRRILKGDGTLYLNCHAISNLLVPARLLLKSLDKAHPHHFSVEDLRSLVCENGFDVTKEKVYRMKTSVKSLKALAGRVAMFHYSVLAKASVQSD
jgi:SAM-dependent methyltransferase